MSCASDDLDQVLRELCTDIFERDDVTVVTDSLKALCSLAIGSRRTQGRIGAIFSEYHCNSATTTTKDCVRSTRFEQLATQFLYNPETSIVTLLFLAAVARNHPVNQRRIARYIKSVRITLPSPPACQLLVLTLPSEVRQLYTTTKNRLLAIANGRTPTGVPPTVSGIPSPCLCNECLGTPQLLATWHDHFQDLSRWCSHGDQSNESSMKSLACAATITGAQLLQHVLDHNYRLCSFQSELIPHAPSEHQPRLYYFHADNDAGSEELTSTVPDPAKHVCAIKIDTNDTPQSNHEMAILRADSRQHASSPQRVFEAAITIPDTVELLRYSSLLPACKDEPKGREDNDVRPSSAEVIHSVGRRGMMAEVAVYSTRQGETIEIVAKAMSSEFRSTLSMTELVNATAPLARPKFGFCIADESVVELVQRCCLCDCHSGKHQSDTRVYLKHNRSFTTKCDEVNLNGLSATATNALRDLHSYLNSPEGVARQTVVKLLQQVIRECNIHLRHLLHGQGGSNNNSGGWEGGSGSGCVEAARERCRSCRDSLIKAAKFVQLASLVDDANISATIRTQLLRVIARVLSLAESRYEWELMDSRVQQFDLNPRAWSNGSPDQAFFAEKEMRLKANRISQDRLNRLLVQQRRNNRHQHNHNS